MKVLSTLLGLILGLAVEAGKGDDKTVFQAAQCCPAD
jgi:hypothetical protein